MIKLDYKNRIKRSDILAKNLLVAFIPIIASLVFIYDDDILFPLLIVAIAIPFSAAFIAVTSILFGFTLPQKVIASRYTRNVILITGVIIGLWIFQNSNRFYGEQRKAFHLATGLHPFLQIKILDFEEKSFREYSFKLHYISNKEYNIKVISQGGYSKHPGIKLSKTFGYMGNETKFNQCYDKMTKDISSIICFDSSYSEALIEYLSE